MNIRKDAEQILKLNDVTMPTVKAIATAILNAGEEVYYCKIAGKKVAIIK